MGADYPPVDCGVAGESGESINQCEGNISAGDIRDHWGGVLVTFATRCCRGFRALTASFTALARFFCRIMFLIRFTHRGSTVGV